MSVTNFYAIYLGINSQSIVNCLSVSSNLVTIFPACTFTYFLIFGQDILIMLIWPVYSFYSIHHSPFQISKPTLPFPLPTPSPPTTHHTTPSSEVKENNLGIETALLPAIGVVLFIVVVGIFLLFVMVSKNKRRSHGVYSPQNEEFKAPIIEMKELKGAKEERYSERLIWLK